MAAFAHRPLDWALWRGNSILKDLRDRGALESQYIGWVDQMEQQLG